VAWALPARVEALLGTPEQRAKRSRAEAREVERSSRAQARAALAERLASPWPAPLAPWMALERGALLSENRTELGGVLDAALALLDGPPEPFRTTDRQHPLTSVVRVLQARAVLLATHAATRRGAPPELAARALGAFQERWARADGDWRYASFRLLVALDRVADLQPVLAGWGSEDDVDARWRRAQGFLEAELGRPAKAIEAFEALRTLEGALGAADLEALATWWLVTGDLARREEVVRERFDVLGEWQLRDWIEQQRRVGSPGGVPGDLPPEVYVALRSLMRRAEWPHNHLWVVRNVYHGQKDHRALASLAHGIRGHGVQAIYGYLQQVHEMIEDVHEEATLDHLGTEVDVQLGLAKRPEDVRGLSLLKALVASRAARVVLKDPSHGERALAALKAAATPTRVPEEIRPLAAYLAQLRPHDAPALSAERTRWLRALREAADVPSGDRLWVARHLAEALWNDGRQDDALDVLAQATAEAVASADPRAQEGVDEAVEQRVGWLVTRGAFAEAERVVLEAGRQAASTAARERWTARLATLWGEGLARGGAFAIGRGEALYTAAQQAIEAAWRARPAEGEAFHHAHVALSDAAREAKLGLDVGADRVRFAKERLPAFYVGWPHQVTELVETEAQALERLASARASLRFALDRMDAEPVQLARLGADAWSQMEWALVQRRPKAEPLGDLGPRLLARVKASLAERVLSESQQVSGFWSTHNQHAWRSVFPELLAAALAASEQRPSASGVQLACAHHLRVMGYAREALGVLESADKRGHLNEHGRTLLLDMFLVAQRYDAALALADRLLAERPEHLTWHKRRARAFTGLKRPADAEAALRTGLERAATTKPPAPALVGDVGSTAADMGLAEPAVTWLEDALTRAEQAGTDRHLWAGWRRHLARALASLDRIDEAVDVASILAVGDRRPHRRELDKIDDEDLPEGVLLRAKDLPAYVARFEAQVAKTGADVPVLRRALARVFVARKDPARALQQLEALREVVPDDTTVLRWLVTLYDAQGRRDEARQALDARLVLEPGDVAGWEDLGRRLTAAGQPEEAERAFTNAIELRPLEPDGHRLMARLALEAQQPAAAAEHWHQVTRVRPLEPEGRLAEAAAWIQAGQPGKARPLLEQVVAGTWEERFGDVKAEAGKLLGTLR
jgi:tetratricopeptide (TPR) repeat protein